MSLSEYDIPICLFVFKRLETVQLIFDVLKKIEPVCLYVFADGPRQGEQELTDSVRKFVDENVTWKCDFHREYSDINLGCSSNIVRGFNKTLQENEYGIFLEDDAVPKVEFFAYCKELLLKYNDKNNNIQYIAGFNAIGDNDIIRESYAFARTAPMSGAIATWKEKWYGQDTTMTGWCNKESRKLINESLLNKEYKKETIKQLEETYKKGCGEWDVIFGYDQLVKNRFAIVPKGNLVRNCGNTESAFHKQSKLEAQKFIKLMDYTKFKFEFPLDYPDCIEWNSEYDRLRQKLFLQVNGNWVQRHLKYAYLFVKNIAYKTLPKKWWKFLKHILSALKK